MIVIVKICCVFELRKRRKLTSHAEGALAGRIKQEKKRL